MEPQSASETGPVKKSDSLPALLKPVEPPPLLYHYTSLEGLMGIVNSGLFWASDIRFLNDSTEGHYVQESLINETRRGELSDGNNIELIRMLTHPPSQSFALCLSELDDDLGQWRAYCPKGRGVCLGINPLSLANCTAAQCSEGVASGSIRSQINRISYAKESIVPAVKEMIVWSGTDKYADGTFKNARIAGICGFVNTFVKHPSFASECEWRIAVDYPLPDFFGPPPPIPTVYFRQGESMLVPYLKIRPHEEPHFLKTVKVGPTPNMQLSLLSVQAYFESLGRPDIEISPSSIPYRSW